MAGIDLRRVIKMILLCGVISGCALLISGVLLFDTTSAFSSLATILAKSSSDFNLLQLASSVYSTNGIPLSLMSVGIMILISVPLAREFVTIFVFEKDKDRFYAIMTALVVIIVILSFILIGPMDNGVRI